MTRVLIIGGSIGGLTAALFLRDAGCDVDVYERSPAPLEGQGAGIVLNPATVRGVTRPADVSVATRFVRYLDDAGHVAHERAAVYRFTSYDALYRALLDRFGTERYHLGHALHGLEQDADGVTVSLADGGRRERCDLLVCADGICSAARRLLLPELAPRYAGYVAWRGTAASTEEDAITYHLLPRGHMLTYPIPGGLTNWLWYRNVEDLDALMTDRTGVRREVSLPPGLVRPDELQRLAEEAARALPPPLRDLVRRCAEPFLQVVCDLEVPRMAFGRACLIGDAAFALRPHAAAGSAKATEDGYRLAEALRDDDIDAALKRWESAQLALGRAVLERTRAAGQRLQFDGTWRVGDPLPFGLYEAGDSLMPTVS